MARLPIASARNPTDSVTDRQVDLAIRRADLFFTMKQGTDGRWTDLKLDLKYPGATTALSILALRTAGASLTDRRLRRSVPKLLDRSEIDTVRARALSLSMWCAINPELFAGHLRDDIRFLEQEQGKDGAWGHGKRTRAGRGKNAARHDGANTQLSLAALSRALAVGADVKPVVWRRAEASLLASQNPDGGWGYPLGSATKESVPSESYGTMSVGGLAAAYHVFDGAHRRAELAFNGRQKAGCGIDAASTKPIRQAMDKAWPWVEENLRFDSIPGLNPTGASDPRSTSMGSYLLAMGRLGILSGRKRIAGRVWARDVAEQLLNTQHGDGSWGGIEETGLSLMALATARAPVLINKLKFGDEHDWNNDSRDAANLTRWYAHHVGNPQSWQVVELDRFSDDILDAPVLLITGHSAPDLSSDARRRIQAFVASGGTILAVACCSRQQFVDECKSLFSKMFPRFTSQPLPADHLVWRIDAEVSPNQTMIGLGDNCRTSVFVLPDASCCAWHQNLITSEASRFQLAGNILRYATFGKEPRSRLRPFVHTPSGTPSETVSVARLTHAGDWWTAQRAMANLSGRLTERYGLGIDERPPVRAADARASDASALWLTGHLFASFTDKETQAVRAYVEEGGLLIASPCCGRPSSTAPIDGRHLWKTTPEVKTNETAPATAFDDAFLDWASEAFAPLTWEPILSTDPIMSGTVRSGLAPPLTGLAYRPRVEGLASPRIDRPVLFGLRHNDRWIVIYSPYDLSCSVRGNPCQECYGYVRHDAESIVGNLLLQAIGDRPKAR